MGTSAHHDTGARMGDAFDLDGQVAIVTGAGGGIGAAIASAFAARGATLVVSDVDADKAKEASRALVAIGAKALAVRADVSSAADVRQLFEQTSSAFGSVHIVVCSAGITSSQDIFTVTEDDWWRVLNVNLGGTMLCAREAFGMFRRQGNGGRLILVGSGVAHQGAIFGQVAYAASKGAVHAMARTLARTGAQYRMTCNVLSPGTTDTPLLRASHTPEQIEEIAAAIPLGITAPADLALAAVFLASRAGEQLTGQTIDVNGGQIIRP